ncbi:MAG TPA: biopolymer transporter ExbD [Acidobacteriota bacterium]|jgi:biopolymer transport protein ExbD
MQRRRYTQIEAYVPTASMADIAFLLIVFFMITTTTTLDKTNVSLPPTLERTEVPRVAAIVALAPDGTLKVTTGVEDSHPLAGGVAALAGFARTLTETNPDYPFILKADAAAPFAAIDSMLEQLRQGRVQRLYLLTEQETMGGGAGAGGS